MCSKQADDRTKQLFLALNRIGEGGHDTVEELCYSCRENRVGGNRAHDFGRATKFIGCFTSHNSRIEVDHPPLPHSVIQRRAIVDLTRVHHYDVAG